MYHSQRLSHSGFDRATFERLGQTLTVVIHPARVDSFPERSYDASAFFIAIRGRREREENRRDHGGRRSIAVHF